MSLYRIIKLIHNKNPAKHTLKKPAVDSKIASLLI